MIACRTRTEKHMLTLLTELLEISCGRTPGERNTDDQMLLFNCFDSPT